MCETVFTNMRPNDFITHDKTAMHKANWKKRLEVSWNDGLPQRSKAQLVARHCASTHHHPSLSCFADHGQAVTQKTHLDRWVQDTQTAELKAIAAEPGMPHYPVVPVQLPFDVIVARMKIMEVCLMAGLNMTQIVAVSPLFKHELSVGTQSLSRLIPTLLQNHLSEVIKPAVRKRPYTICFDGTSRFCNVEAMLVWVFNERTFEPHSHLVKLQLPVKKPNAHRLKGMMVNALGAVELELEDALAASHDSASVNLAAVKMLQDDHEDLFDLPCTSHILDRAGLKFDIPEAKAVVSKLNEFYSRGNGEATWREKMHYSFGTISETRWWSWWEQVCSAIYPLMLAMHSLFVIACALFCRPPAWATRWETLLAFSIGLTCAMSLHSLFFSPASTTC